MATSPKARLFVAEDVRQEIDGKVSLIGLFADGVVIARGPVPKDEPIALRSLAFLVTLSELPEEPESFSVYTELVGTDGEAKPFSARQQVPNPGPGRSANMIFVVAPISFAGPGKRTIRVHVDKHIIDLPYEFRVEEAARRADQSDTTKAASSLKPEPRNLKSRQKSSKK